MRATRLVLAGYFAAVLLQGAEVSGQWSAEESHGGNTIHVTMNLQLDEDGTTLTGTLTGPSGEADITDGRIDDDEISFSVIGDRDGRQITRYYRGTIEEDLIHFRLRVEGGRGAGGSVEEFDARRVSSD